MPGIHRPRSLPLVWQDKSRKVRRGLGDDYSFYFQSDTTRRVLGAYLVIFDIPLIDRDKSRLFGVSQAF
jgi:hypothetical protein